MFHGSKIKSEQVHRSTTGYPNVPGDTRVKITLAARSLQTLRRCELVYSPMERKFILKHC